MIVRSGIDLIEINRFTEISPQIRERFLMRVFRVSELEFCDGRDERLAGRFAVKEAVAKALGTGFSKITWQDVEVLCGSCGEPLLSLHGAAAQIADQLGLKIWSISITHNRTTAAAVAVAIG